MRKYFIFKHEPSFCMDICLGNTTMVEVYSFADILHLLSVSGKKIENARIMPQPLKVLNMNYEWSGGAYQIIGMCDGKAKCIGVCNFKE